jgi:transposase
MERKVYSGDLSREQFEGIRGLLESAKRRTTPRKTDLYDVFCALLYLLKNGCPWRALPGDFPKWNAYSGDRYRPFRLNVTGAHRVVLRA